MNGALLVCGTHSDAGKSVVTAGICRWLHRAGVRVAPFKAQNMALNSVVTPDGSVVNQVVMAAPMIALYIVSIGVAWLFGKQRTPDEETA